MDFEIEKNEKENKKENNNDKKSKIVMGGTTAVLVIGGIFVYNTLSDKENNEPPIKTEQAVKSPSLEEKTNEEFEEKDKNQIEGDLGVVSEGFKKFSEMNAYRFTYSIKGQYQEERIIMDNTITGKYDNQLGYIKQFTTNNKEQLSYNVMYDVEKKENFYNKNEVITKLDQSIASGLLENYEWVSLKEDEISDRNIFLTKMNFSEKRKLLLEMEDGKLYTQTLTEQDILEGVSKIFVYKTDKEDLNKIR